MAHEFNNKLQAVSGFAEIALELCEPGSRVATYLEKILDHIDRSLSLTGELLRSSCAAVLDCQRVRPEALVRDALGERRGEGIAIAAEPELPELLVDCALMCRALGCVFDSVERAAGCRRITARISREHTPAGDMVRFAVGGGGPVPPMVQRVAQQHGGFTRVERSPGGASTCLYLPIPPG